MCPYTEYFAIVQFCFDLCIIYYFVKLALKFVLHIGKRSPGYHHTSMAIYIEGKKKPLGGGGAFENKRMANYRPLS